MRIMSQFNTSGLLVIKSQELSSLYLDDNSLFNTIFLLKITQMIKRYRWNNIRAATHLRTHL